MIENPKYNLEQRTYDFALSVRRMVAKLPYNIINAEDTKQVVRSSGSIGANYIEANETVGEKDFRFRLKISRKEAKESIYWLHLLKEMNDEQMILEMEALITEATELRKIFSAIINKFNTK